MKFSIQKKITVVFIIGCILGATCGYLSGHRTIGKKPCHFAGGKVLSPHVASNGGEVRLFDLCGNPVKSWKTKNEVSFARFLEPNYLVTSEVIFPDDFSVAPGNKPTGALRIYNLSGDLAWEFQDPKMHHEFEFLPNGNILYIRWSPVPMAYAASIKGGMPNSEWNGKIWGDELIELKLGVGIVSRKELFKSLNPTDLILPDHLPRADWLHLNSVKYYPKSIFGPDEILLLSFRNVSRVAVVRASDLKLLWMSRPGEFSSQHDPTIFEDQLWVFDNRLGSGRSRLVQMNIKTNEILWEYEGGESFVSQAQFYTAVMGAFQIQSPDEFMVTMSVHGYVFGLTKDKQRTWHLYPGGSNHRSKAQAQSNVYKPVYYPDDFLESLN